LSGDTDPIWCRFFFFIARETFVSDLHPLLIKPIYKEKVWGGRTLEQALGRDLPGGSDTLVGESWELVDLATTSASGGGGGAARSVIANGPAAGKTLAGLIAEYGRSILGDLPLSEDGGFPILLKYLDASQNLSVQVHPSPEYAASHDDAYLKSEAWYIVSAAPGSVIYKGIKEGVTPQQLREAIEKNTDKAVVPLMVEVPVKAGDCHYLPSGTCHALGGGILVAEVQTPSDTTYRVYDWGRTGRELHVEQAIECIHFGPAETEAYELFTPIGDSTAQVAVTRMVSCEFFRMDKVEASSGYSDAVGSDQPTVWMVVDGQGVLTCDGHEDTPIAKGDTVLLPPAMQGGQIAVDQSMQWIEVTFPQAERKHLAG
jgi:mannose-6-phosphate isomerase